MLCRLVIKEADHELDQRVGVNDTAACLLVSDVKEFTSRFRAFQRIDCTLKAFRLIYFIEPLLNLREELIKREW